MDRSALIRQFRTWADRSFQVHNMLPDEELGKFIDSGAIPLRPLPDSTRSALNSIPDSIAPRPLYPAKPAQVRLKSGKILDTVLFVGELQYVPYWGLEARQFVPVDQIASVAISPLQLPPHIAKRVASIGETNMGGSALGLTMKDGKRFYWIVGNLDIDFIKLPSPYRPTDIAAVEPLPEDRFQLPTVESKPDLWFCLYAEPENVIKQHLGTGWINKISVEEYLDLRPSTK